MPGGTCCPCLRQRLCPSPRAPLAERGRNTRSQCQDAPRHHTDPFRGLSATGIADKPLQVKAAHKRALHMKRIVRGGMGAVVVLWLGYYLGYHHALREERRAWEATREVSIISVTNRGVVNQATRIFYSDPHNPLYFVVGPTGRGARQVLNSPDPRSYEHYERSLP